MRRLFLPPAPAVWLMLMCAPCALAQPAGTQGQAPATPVAGLPPALQDVPGRVKVFIDCGGSRNCDTDYFRTVLTFVDHVRDREVADVHILITAQRTGSGGQEATIAFIGRGAFSRADDALRYVSLPTSTTDAIRQGLAQKITLGLVRYVSHSANADHLEIGVTSDAPQAPAQPKTDPWNYWVMRVRVNGSARGEASSSAQSYSGGASANRVTDAWKVNLSANGSYRESSYDLGDDDRYVSISRESGANVLVVKSLTGHWSAGLRGSVGSSTYTNKTLYVSAAPAIEYNVFPYRESTRRSFTFQYSLGLSAYAYREETLYDKMSETLPQHAVNVDVEAKQPWGQISASVDVSQYLSQPENYRVESFGMIDIRLKKGLSFNVGGGGSWIRDQIYLPKGEASTEDILVRQRQLKTSYSYSVYFGLSYTFGSIYNNIVNPRFGSGGGGGMVSYY